MAEATPEADMSKYVPLSSPYSPTCGLIGYSSPEKTTNKFFNSSCFLRSQAKGFGFGIKTTEALSLLQVDRFIGPSQVFGRKSTQ